MGVCTFGVYKLIFMVIKSNAIATMVSIAAAVAVYGVLLIKLKCMDEDELRQMPGGTRLLGILKRAHLM
jgi:stage V sporulation protein B